MACGCGGASSPTWFGNNVWRCNRCGDDCLAVRPQGPEGPTGPDGITPAFEVGTVGSGGNPSVVITQVSPTLYRLDFILPEAYTAGDNVWTGSNTFLGDVVVSGSILYANGGLTTAFLVVTSGATFNGAVIGGTLILTDTSTLVVSGTSTFDGDVSMSGNVSISGNLTVDGDVTITGDVEFDLPAVGSGRSRGDLVLDECGALKYLQGTSNFTPVTQGESISVTVNPGDPETQLGNPIIISIAVFSCAPGDEVQYVDIMSRVNIQTTILDTGFYAVNLWADSIGGVLLDTCEVGEGAQLALLNAVSVAITPGVSRQFYLSVVDGSTPPSFAASSSAVITWVT